MTIDPALIDGLQGFLGCVAIGVAVCATLVSLIDEIPQRRGFDVKRAGK